MHTRPTVEGCSHNAHGRHGPLIPGNKEPLAFLLSSKMSVRRHPLTICSSEGPSCSLATQPRSRSLRMAPADAT